MDMMNMVFGIAFGFGITTFIGIFSWAISLVVRTFVKIAR